MSEQTAIGRDAQHRSKRAATVDQDEQPVAAAQQAKPRAVTHVLAIDVETTGRNLLLHWMPEFAASAWRIGADKPHKTFYRMMEQPSDTEWCAHTLTEFWRNPDKGVDGIAPIVTYAARRVSVPVEVPFVAMAAFVDWAREIDAELQAAGETLLVITDTAAYDTTWINYYLCKYCPQKCTALSELFGEYRPTRDISAFYFGVGRRLAKHGSVETALAALDAGTMPSWVTTHQHNHNPLSDANSIAATASFILARCE